MKHKTTVMNLMKAMSFLLIFLIVNSVYSQCTPGATFSITYNSNCSYTFTPVLPGSPCVTSVRWTFGSTGTAASACETLNGSPGINYRFCFYGNQDVTMIVRYCNNNICTITQTVNVTCAGAEQCDPDNLYPDAHPCPLVEITYMGPETCAVNQTSAYTGCMYYLHSSQYDISCGWVWAIRKPITFNNCDIYTYYVQYLDATTCGTYPCTTLILDTTVQCIVAQIGQPIYIIAVGNHCCFPAGFQRGFFWTPMPTDNTLTTISDPILADRYGSCSAFRSCPVSNSGNCDEDRQMMCEVSNFPSSCFASGPKLEKRIYSLLAENTNIEQNVIIYNIDGKEVFSGKWKFGDPKNLNLNWPDNFQTGLYIIKFQNSKKLTKLFKLN